MENEKFSLNGKVGLKNLTVGSSHQPSKKNVTFNDYVNIHPMIVWSFAYRQHRKTYWEFVAVDRWRFRRRINKFEGDYNRIKQSQ